MFRIVAKQYVLTKYCLQERIGNQGKKVDILGCHRLSTSGFASTATKTAVCLFFARTAKRSVLDGIQMDILVANHMRIVGLYSQN